MEFDLGPDDELDHEGPVPVYQQLAAILEARIRRGDWKVGRAIPSEKQVEQEFGVARNTVRRAVRHLAEREVVYVVPRRGTFVQG
ncbi:GntR family transcriptional regulator [Nocardiopsis sp. NPDC101807]|uniref:GntR family transcriptional regulator n=1 Tax=Nocardiopsis sp. NPDC101807 TaxID=3364339 RepID=UPI0037FD76B1